MEKQDYLQMLQGLLPQGKAWNREPDSNLTKLLSAAAAEFAKIDARIRDIIKESDPRSALETLEEWELEFGLPDPCSEGFVTTIQERRQAVLQKMLSRGGQSPKYYKELAAVLGYDIIITENVPFRVGKSRCGQRYIEGPYSRKRVQLTDTLDILFTWNTRVLGPRVTFFRVGVSRVGKDPLAKITRAEDLECIFNRNNQSHAKLTFAYEGA